MVIVWLRCLVLATALYCGHCGTDVMIITRSTDIYTCVLMKSPMCTRRMLLNMRSSASPAYDPVEDYIYWADRHGILRTYFLDGSVERWKSFGIWNLAIDPSIRLLFVALADLITIDLTTTEETVVIKNMTARRLSLDTDNRKIYFQDEDSVGVMNYDGSERHGIFKTYYSRTSTLAFGGTGQLYYSNYKGQLMSWNMETKTSQLLRDGVTCVSISVFGGNVYYIDYSIVFILNQTGLDDQKILNSDYEYILNDLTVSRRRDGKPLGSSRCVEDGRGGAVWEPFRLNTVCNISSLAESELSMSLRDVLMNYTMSSQNKEVMKKTRSITKNRTLSVLDVLYITDILEKTSQGQDISTQDASDLIEIANTVSESDANVITEADEAGWVGNRLFLTLDSVTAKLEPGPLGNSNIRTDILESELWDLRHENITALPIGLLLNETDVSIQTLYNENLDYSTTDFAIKLTRYFVSGIVNGSKGKSVRLSMNVYRKPLLFLKKEEFRTESSLVLDSKIISAKILVDDLDVTDLHGSQVTFMIKTDKVENKSERVCGYWNFTKGGWSTDGCNRIFRVNNEKDVCVCDHLTNFAILLDVDGRSVAPGHLRAWNIITTTGVSFSAAGLSITLVTFLIFRDQLKNEAPKTLFNLCLAQLCAWIVFLAGFNQTESYLGCIVSGALLHYFIMAAFLWMLAEAILAYLLLVKVYKSGAITPNYMWKTGLSAWIIPAVPVITVLTVGPDLYMGRETHCWLSWWTSLFAFIIPIGLIILCNAVFYGLIVFKMCTKKNVGQTRVKGHKENMFNVRLSIIFFVVFGLSWVFGFLAVAEAKVIFQYIFCVTASIQGFLVFLLFTVRNKEVRKSFYKLCRGKKTLARKNDIDMKVFERKDGQEIRN